MRGVLISETFKSSTERNAAFISSVIGASGSGARWVPRWAPPREAKAGSPGTFRVCGLRGPPVPVGDSEEGNQPPRLRDHLQPALLTSEGCQALEWSCSLSSLQAGLGWDSPCAVVLPRSPGRCRRPHRLSKGCASFSVRDGHPCHHGLLYTIGFHEEPQSSCLFLFWGVFMLVLHLFLDSLSQMMDIP